MMNFIKNTVFIFGFIALFDSCTEDEKENNSCFTCETTQTEYCYTVGNTYYVTTDADGTTHQTELNGTTWSDTQDILETQCNGTTKDCYTCTVTDTMSCYTQNDAYYVSTTNNISLDIPLEGMTWEERKLSLEELCDFYFIIGEWNLTDYYRKNVDTNQINGDVSKIEETLSLTAENDFKIIFKDSYEFYYSGQYVVDIEITPSNEWYPFPDTQGYYDGETSEHYQWEINENNLVLLSYRIEDRTANVIELTEEKLKLQINFEYDYNTDEGVPFHKTVVVFETYER